MKNVTLQIKRKEFDMIMAGTKKTEWRSPSKYNLNLLFVPDPEFDGKLNGNPEITSITFLNGRAKDSPQLTIEVIKRIREVKFSRDIDLPDDNFHALEGQFAIEISLGKILEIKNC